MMHLLSFPQTTLPAFNIHQCSAAKQLMPLN
jgi:hypothetical protein